MVQKKAESSSKRIFKFSKLSTGQKITLIVALIGFTGAIVAALIKIIPDVFKSNPPEFQLVKGVVYHPDSTIIIRAINKPAMTEQSIIFEIDGYCLHEAADFVYQGKNLVWKIEINHQGLPVNVRCDGEHQVRFGFSQNNMSQGQKIYFDSKSPQTFVRLDGESKTEKRIYGQVVDESPLPDQNISVEVAFQHQEQLKTTQIPVKSYVDSTGRKMFDFEYQVQNIPQVSKDDPNYNQPFFAIKVTDEAGNEFHHSATYGKFIAEGIETFGTKSAEILFQKIDDEKIPIIVQQARSPKKQPESKMIDVGEPLITLRVLIRTPNYVQLSWNRLPEKLRATPDEYVVIRQNQELGASFDTTYTDRSIFADSAYQYQVWARGSDDKYYTSNILPLTLQKQEEKKLLRSIAMSLTAEQVTTMLKSKDFFDSAWNQTGMGYDNQFTVKIINDDTVVFDGASGLMWQKGGSSEEMTYEQAKQWIQVLNQRGYAGYHDWRLATLEETMSLMEPKEKSGSLFIHPVFDSKQWRIWTSDLVLGESRAWVVGFDGGGCGRGGFASFCVRAVRSGQSDKSD